MYRYGVITRLNWSTDACEEIDDQMDGCMADATTWHGMNDDDWTHSRNTGLLSNIAIAIAHRPCIQGLVSVSIFHPATAKYQLIAGWYRGNYLAFSINSTATTKSWHTDVIGMESCEFCFHKDIQFGPYCFSFLFLEIWTSLPVLGLYAQTDDRDCNGLSLSHRNKGLLVSLYSE